MAENDTPATLYEELLFRLDRGLLSDPCAVWLQEHVRNCREQLSAARAVLMRAVELSDAARRLQVAHAVAADSELLDALIALQQSLHQRMEAIAPSVIKQEHHECGYASESSTESESERLTSLSVKRMRQESTPSTSKPSTKPYVSASTPVPVVDVVDVAADAAAKPKARDPELPKPKTHLLPRGPALAPVKNHLMRLAQVRDGSATLRHIQALMSWSPWPSFGASCAEEWAWVRSLAKQIVAVGSVVENLSREKRLPRNEGVLVVATISSVVMVIVPAASKLPDIVLPMNARELVALMKALQQILMAFPRYNLNNIMKNVKNLLEFLKFRHPNVAREWNSKCNMRVKYRKQIAQLLATLDEWDGTGLCRAAAMDQLMEQFNSVLKPCNSMWDVSCDEIVLDCIRMMEKLLSTFKAGTKKQGERLMQIAAWKNEIKNSNAKGRKTAPGSMFLPVLESMEKAVLISVGAALLGPSTPAVSATIPASVNEEDEPPTHVTTGLYAQEARLARACVAPAQKQAEHLAKGMAVSQGHNVNVQLRAIKAAAKIPDAHLASGFGATDVLRPLHRAFAITVDVFSKQEPWDKKVVNQCSMVLQAVNKSASERLAFKRLFNEQRMKLEDVLQRRGNRIR